MAPTRGRPPQQITRNQWLAVRLTPMEYLAVQRAARARQMSLSQWVRRVLAAAPPVGPGG